MSLKSLSVALLATAATYSVAPAMAAGDLNVICSADVVICEQLQGDFEAKHDIKVNMVRLSSGESYAKIFAPNPAIRRPISGGAAPATRIFRQLLKT